MNSSRSRLGVAVVAALVTTQTLAAAPVQKTEPAPPQLRLHQDLQRDPLLVVAWAFEDSEEALSHLLDVVERFSATDAPAAPGPTAARLETRLRPALGELFGAMGSEVALVADMMPFDQALLSFDGTRNGLLETLLGRVGVVAAVTDEARMRTVLEKLWPQDTAAPAAAIEGLRLHWGVGRGRAAIGFSEEWVQAALRPRPPGERLIDGADWKRVFAHLDAEPSGLYYVNLPRLRQRLVESSLLTQILSDTPAAARFVETFLTSQATTVGLGSTSVVVGGGVRSTGFGPPWVPGSVTRGGLVAAVALPSLLRAADRDRVVRTGADLRAIGEACEQFSVDVARYPGPTEGWVPVARIASYLEPVYIGDLPTTDAWQNPILYWSDGGSYRVISTGRDGEMERDWSSGASPDSRSDIVVGDNALYLQP